MIVAVAVAGFSIFNHIHHVNSSSTKDVGLINPFIVILIGVRVTIFRERHHLSHALSKHLKDERDRIMNGSKDGRITNIVVPDGALKITLKKTLVIMHFKLV